MAFRLTAIRERARRLRVEALALGLAVRHPDTPWIAKVVVAGLVAYVLMPVDLAPDALPVLGLVDDAIFIPIALAIALRFVPSAIVADCRDRAERIADGAAVRRATRIAALVAYGSVLVVAVLLAVLAA